MPIEPTWEETTAVEEPKWEDTTDVETKTPGFLGPAFPLQEGEPPAAPQQDTSAAQAMTQWFQPAPPTNALQIQPMGDVNAPMPEQKPFLQEAQEPAINYQIQHPANEGVLAAVGREAANLALAAAEFPTSEAGAAAGMASAVAPTAVTGLFTLQMMKDLGNQILSTYQNWGSMTPAQKAIAITDIAGTGVLGTIMGKATAKGLRRMGKTEPAIAAAEPILPQAAQAAKETKGAEEYASEVSKAAEVHGDVQPLAGKGVREVPVEEGRPRVLTQTEGGIPEAQAPSPPPEQRGVLLTPEERATEQRALDEALGQETEANLPPAKLSPSEAAAAKAVGLKIVEPPSSKNRTIDIESTPPPKETPTAPSAAEPSSQTPATQGISEATTPSEKAQVSTEPFLGKTKAEWADYYDTLSKEQKLSAISQTNRALKSAGLRPRLTTESQKSALLKAINEIIDLREKKKAATPTEPPPTLQLRVLPPLGIVEFVKQDVIPFVKKGVDTAKATAKLFVDTFSPASHAETPDVNILFEGKGFKEKVETRIVSAFENMKKRFDAMPQADQIAFVDRVKRGQAQPTPELQATANLIRKWDDVLYSLITRYKPTVPYLDNHMRVLWQKVPGQPTAIGTQKAGIRGKRPFQGSKGFLKKHVLADMSEGIRLGGVPVTYNPVELFTLHAQDVMKFVAANRAWEGLKRIGSVEFVRRGHKAPVGFVRFDDPIAKTYFRVPQGLVAPGEYYVQEGTGRMLHNYLSRDWVRTGPAGPIGRALLGLKNFTTNIELGMSPFHAFFESNEAIGSSFGLGLRKISSGQYLAGLKDIAQALPSSIPIVGPLIPKTAPWETAKLGGRLIKYAKNPAEFAAQDPEGFAWLRQHYPETQKLVNDLFTAGGQVGMHQEYRYALRRGFAQAVRTENYVGAVIRALPALNQVMQKPLFETYIPRLKVGMWLREYSQALVDRAGDLATGKTTRPQLARETWSFIEDRFGELNWDNLYWNRTMKSAMQLMFRSVTWKLGNLRGFGKAGRDVAGEVVWRALVQGKAPRMSYPMMWLAGMSLVTAIQSSIISKVSTGKYPWELVDEGLGYLKSGVDLLKNLTFPRIDGKDPTQRVSIPTYWRDAVHIARSAKGLGWDYIRSSMTGEINRFAESLNNKDFYGHPIYNPLDPIQKRAYDFMAHLIPTPFGISSYQRATETGASTPQALAGVAGYTKAPAAIEPAPTSQVYDLAENWMAQQGGKTQETARRRAVQEQRHAEEPSIYQPLKIALKANRMDDAGKEYDKLLALRRSTESVSDRHKQILLALRPFTMGKKEPGTDYQPKHMKPFTGNLADEKKFLKSLTPEQRKVYDAAIASKQEIYQRFLELMKTR